MTSQHSRDNMKPYDEVYRIVLMWQSNIQIQPQEYCQQTDAETCEFDDMRKHCLQISAPCTRK